MSVPNDVLMAESLKALILDPTIDPHSKVLFLVMALNQGALTAEELGKPAQMGRQQIAAHMRRWIARGVVIRSKRADYALERFIVTYQMAKPIGEADLDGELDGAPTE